MVARYRGLLTGCGASGAFERVFDFRCGARPTHLGLETAQKLDVHSDLDTSQEMVQPATFFLYQNEAQKQRGNHKNLAAELSSARVLLNL